MTSEYDARRAERSASYPLLTHSDELLTHRNMGSGWRPEDPPAQDPARRSEPKLHQDLPTELIDRDSLEPVPDVPTSPRDLENLILRAIHSLHSRQLDTLSQFLNSSLHLASIKLHQNSVAAHVVPRGQRYPNILSAFRLLHTSIALINEAICLDAVLRGNLTRRNAAAILDVHENTVARWVKNSDSHYQKIEEQLRKNLYRSRNEVLGH